MDSALTYTLFLIVAVLLAISAGFLIGIAVMLMRERR